MKLETHYVKRFLTFFSKFTNLTLLGPRALSVQRFVYQFLCKPYYLRRLYYVRWLYGLSFLVDVMSSCNCVVDIHLTNIKYSMPSRSTQTCYNFPVNLRVRIPKLKSSN